MQMQNGSGRDNRASFRLLAIKRGRSKHPNAHEVIGIGDFEADFGGTNIRVESRQNVVNLGFEGFAGISVQPDIRKISDVNGIKIVFVNVTDNPDVRKVGDGEWIGSGQSLHTAGIDHLLISDDAGNRRDDIYDPTRMVFINAQQT